MPMDRAAIDRTLATPYGEKAYALVASLVDHGFDAWWVGGCVREMLTGNIPRDIDIATDATPEELCTLFPTAREVPRPLGSVRIRSGRFQYEVTTFREESAQSDGRIPSSIRYSKKEEDAQRRDFTINAIYFHPISRELYDPFDGEGDLKERLLRFVGNPHERIVHDALRILRAVRFRAAMKGQYHPETFAALREHASLVALLSGIRKLEELEKLLKTEHPDRGFEDLWELGVLPHLIPKLHVCKGIPQPAEYHQEGDVWEHILKCLRSLRTEDGIDVRWAALFHDVGKAETFARKERIRFDHHASISAEIAQESLAAFQMSNRRIEKISWLIKHHMMMGSLLEMPVERKAHWYFHEWFDELLRLFWLDIAGTEPSDFSLYDTIVRDRIAFLDAHPRPQKILLTGKDVMKLTGIEAGEKVGELLAKIEQAQGRGEITTKAEARDFLRSITEE